VVRVLRPCLAVPHPPGYPTYTMLATISQRLFLKLGFSPAYGSNMATVVAGAAAAGVLFAAIHTAVSCGGTEDHGKPVRRVEGGDGDGGSGCVGAGGGGGGGGGGRCAAYAAAALGSGLFAFSRNVWMYSIQSEVFALNNLFVALAILFAVRFGRKAEAAAAATAAAAAAAAESKGRDGTKEQKGGKCVGGSSEGGGDGGSGVGGGGGGGGGIGECERRGAVTKGAAAEAAAEAVAGAFVCGLAMTNQHTFVLFGTPLALWVLGSGRHAGLWRPLPLLAMFTAPLLGLVGRTSLFCS